MGGAIATLKTRNIYQLIMETRGKDGLSTVVEVVNILISNNFEFIGDSNLRKAICLEIALLDLVYAY